MESHHLFVKCSFAAGVWFGSPVPLCTNVVHSDSLKTFVIEMGSNLDRAQRTRFLLCLAVIIDTIWSKRNALWHNLDEKAVNVREILDSVHRKFWEFSQICENGDTVLTVPASPSSEVQNLPTANRLIFVDGSFKEGKIGAGMLAWDRVTMDWFFEAKATDGMSEIAAEVYAWLSAFQWAKKE
uniref:RNase H type-1 domain-containing protein n=1 Tax=Cannabis sativa TaxID=3483 RepID=A0A803NSP1_CANSA